MATQTFTIASGETYTSFANYVSTEAQNLVSAGDHHIVTMDRADDPSEAHFTGWTTTTTNYIKVITTGARAHGGQAGNWHFSSVNKTVIRPVSSCDGLWFDGIAIRSGTIFGNNNGGTDFRGENCFLEGGWNVDLWTISQGSGYCRNNMLVDGNDGFISMGTAEFCTAISCTNRGFVNIVGKNCISLDCGTDFNQMQGGSGYNLSSDDTADDVGSGGIIDQTSTNILVSVTDGSEDLNLLNGTNQANGNGIAISGITTDYAGNTRADPPCIGAHEFIAAGTSAKGPLGQPLHGTFGGPI